MNMNGAMDPEAASNESDNHVPFPFTVDTRVKATGQLCIPCAVKNPDFKERAPLSTGTPFEDPTVRAWIGGRSFGLLRHPSTKLRCGRCGQEAPVTYVPEEQQAA
jgi:hypothetical protein